MKKNEIYKFNGYTRWKYIMYLLCIIILFLAIFGAKNFSEAIKWIVIDLVIFILWFKLISNQEGGYTVNVEENYLEYPTFFSKKRINLSDIISVKTSDRVYENRWTYKMRVNTTRSSYGFRFSNEGDRDRLYDILVLACNMETR